MEGYLPVRWNKRNVKVKKFNQARVNGGSNYDSLKEFPAKGKYGRE
jgi:hypothetical protein